MRFRIALLVACAVLGVPCTHPSLVLGQEAKLTRADALRLAVERGARLGVAIADTAVASAQLVTASTLPNPSFNPNYTKDTPHWHMLGSVPLDLPMFRRPRIQSAQLGVQAAQLRYRLARATIALDADTIYTRVVAAREHLALSRRNAVDADSLLHMVERRRDAGDAADMDVELARVSAGQQENAAGADSLTLESALLDLQASLGMATEHVEVQASDSLTPPPEPTVPGQTLNEAAAALSLQSAAIAAQLQHRPMWLQPSITGGVEFGASDEHGLLPALGIGFGLPIFDRNQGPIAQAEAERVRAAAELTLAQVESRTEIAHAQRERENAMAKVERDRRLLGDANTVAAMSLTAYREGASSLPNVLEAQRSTRDILGQYIDDLAAAWIATSELRVLSLTPSSPIP